MEKFVSQLKELKNKTFPWQCSFCGFNTPTQKRSICTRAFGINTCSDCSGNPDNREFLVWLETPTTWNLQL